MNETQESNPMVADYLLGPPSGNTPILVAPPCEKCVSIQNDKSELWRLRRDIKTLLSRIDKLILSQE